MEIIPVIFPLSSPRSQQGSHSLYPSPVTASVALQLIFSVRFG